MGQKQAQLIAAGICICLSGTLQAYTQYTWNGAASSDWMVAGNWLSGSIAPTGGVTDTRMIVNNGVNNELLYTEAMGTTLFMTTGVNARSLLIANAANGQLRITGGTLIGQGSAPSSSSADVIALNGGTGKLIVDGGAYYRTNDVPTGSDTGEELQIAYNYNNSSATSGELIISNGVAKVREIRMNFANLDNVSGAIHLNGGLLETFKIKASGTKGTRAVYFNGGTLKNGFADQADWFINISAWIKAGGAVIDTAGFTSTLSAALTPDGSSTAGLIKKGNGRLTLAGNNSYRGLTSITGGVLRASHNNALGTTDSGTTVSSGARLELQGGITVSSEPLFLYGRGLTSDGIGALLSTGGTNTWAGPVTLMGDGTNPTRIGASGGDLVISGLISDNGNNYGLLIRNVDGNMTDTITLSNTNTYGGRTIIYQGVLKLAGGSNRLPIRTILQLGFFNTGYLLTGHFDLNGCDQELAGLEVNANILEAQQALRETQVVKNDAETPAILTLNNAVDYTFTGRLLGNLGLTKKGAGTFTLSSTNSYSGATSISNGVLQLAQADCLSANTDVVISTAASATLNLNFSGTNTVRSLTVDGQLKYKDKVYNASNLPGIITGTGCLLTVEGIQGTRIHFR